MTETPATLAAAKTGLDHEVVEYGRVASVEEAAEARGVDLRQVIKTIVVRRGDGDHVMVLVPGDRVIDWGKLRALLGVSRLSLAAADEAIEATGYAPGTITPFGSSTVLPVIADAAIDGLVSIGGGAHGVAIHLDATDLTTHFEARVADVTRSSQ